MLMRTLLVYLSITVCAVAFHENTFAVFELRELLIERQLNLWELFEQLEYVTDEQRAVVYAEIEEMKQQIMDTIDLLVEHDQAQHP